MGVSRLNALVVTHGDAGHIGGARALLETFPAKRVVDSVAPDRSSTRKQLNEWLADRRIPKTSLKTGDTLEMRGENKMEVLHPPEGASARTANDKALVLRLTIEGTRVLMLSDASYAVERSLLESGADLRASILVCGEGTPRREFLAAVQPAAIIAAKPGEGEDAGTKSHFLSETGAVEIRFFGGRYEISTFLSDEKAAHRFDSSDEQAIEPNPGSAEPAH